MEPAVYDDLPAWGQLPAEQYLIRHWNPASAESPAQQRVRLIQEFLHLDQTPEELDPTFFGIHAWKPGPHTRTPTEEEIATILRPWRPDRLRWTAWNLWRDDVDDRNPVLLRTYYDPKDDERVRGWTTLCEDYEAVSEWSLLDNPQLFDFEASAGGGPEERKPAWLRIFDILPEISKPFERYSRLVDWERFGEFRTNFKDMLDYVKREHPGWRDEPDLLITKNDAAISLLHVISTTQVLIADKEAFATNQLLLVFLDAKQNITMQGRIDITEERIDQLAVDWGQGEQPIEVFQEGTVGEGYLVDGEPGKRLYQWTKQDLEDDPTSDVSRAADGLSRMDV
ncbi:hypothetical protein BJX63DRAFT_151083 [Aspergillus granulosus]|uniref:Uncharacterized protein n=1 Tax=Aspergillus granulosus TaxID=176169 RepID=A0ABR4GSD9_9EURO